MNQKLYVVTNFCCEWAGKIIWVYDNEELANKVAEAYWYYVWPYYINTLYDDEFTNMIESDLFSSISNDLQFKNIDHNLISSWLQKILIKNEREGSLPVWSIIWIDKLVINNDWCFVEVSSTEHKYKQNIDVSIIRDNCTPGDKITHLGKHIWW